MATCCSFSLSHPELCLANFKHFSHLFFPNSANPPVSTELGQSESSLPLFALSEIICPYWCLMPENLCFVYFVCVVFFFSHFFSGEIYIWSLWLHHPKNILTPLFSYNCKRASDLESEHLISKSNLILTNSVLSVACSFTNYSNFGN